MRDNQYRLLPEKGGVSILCTSCARLLDEKPTNRAEVIFEYITFHELLNHTIKENNNG